jgi:transmembrane sensor
MRKTAQKIDEEAAHWVARVDRGPLSGREEAALEAWLAHDIRAAGAYHRMEALALHSLRAAALGKDFDPATFRPRLLTRRWAMAGSGSIAAGLLVAGATWSNTRSLSYRTGKGEVRVLPLEDGSVITLNTESELRVRFSQAQREVELAYGEALFEVAKNKTRPFIVRAGDTRVKVVGTSFTVRNLEENPVQVLVRSGIVEVSKAASHKTVVPVQVTANTKVVSPVGEDTVQAKPIAVVQLRREMAWQAGLVAFEGKSLAEAAAEFARYSNTRIVIDDPGLGQEEIAGLFRANDPVGFARKISMSLNAHTRMGDGEVHIAR